VQNQAAERAKRAEQVDAEQRRKAAPEVPDSGQMGSGNVRTVFVFLDLPVHCEFRAITMPLMPEGTVIEFDDMKVRGPEGRPGREWTVSGPYRVARRKCVYSSGRPSLSGLTQYLEMRQVT